MVCAECRAGGKGLQSGAPPEHVKTHHDKCRGGTWCDCRHGLVSSLNTLLVKPKNEVVE